MQMDDREREEAIIRLNRAIEKDDGGEKALWEAVKAFRKETFFTSGRGSRPGLPFSYDIKVSNRTGEETDELVIDRRGHSKSITRSTVWLGYCNGREEQQRAGFVKGPKKLGCFGASYLYPLFIRLGLFQKNPSLD